MTQFLTSQYWLAPQALTFTLNALGDPQKVAVSVSSGAMVMAYMPGVEGLGFDNAHSYRRWPVSGYASVLKDAVVTTTDAEGEPTDTIYPAIGEKYVYILIPRNAQFGSTALVGFAPCIIDYLGYTEEGVHIGTDQYYYLYIQGIISASVEGGNRTWQQDIVSGTLATEEAYSEGPDIPWYRWNALSQSVSFLKRIVMDAASWFSNLRTSSVQFVGNGTQDKGTLTSVADFGTISDSDTGAVVTTKYLADREEEIEKKYLRKDQDDETTNKLTFADIDIKKVAQVFDMLKSDKWVGYDMIFGTGWGVDHDGNMQVESLEVRSALRVLELVYNRLSAEESEYVFTESGNIKECIPQGGNKYKVIMEKRGDTDFHAFRVGDVLRGIVNNLSNLGGGEYYTTWLHVESIDPHGDNSMVVSMYPASDCPSGKNYEPTSLMVVQRWGNSIPATKENHENPEYRAIIDLVDGKYVNRRQSCWYLSSNEKRIAMLDGVNQPKVSKGNYAAFFGLPYDIDDISGHSLNPSQPYLYCRGAFIQDLHFIDYLGKVIKMERFRGNWDADVASSIDPYVTNSNTYDTVYHNNSKWECIASQAKGEPSKDNKDEWKLLQEVLSTSIIQLVPSATSIQRDVNGEPYIDYVSCKIQKNTGDKIEILPTDNLYYSINGVSLTQGAYVPLAKDDGIEYIEFILMPTEGDRFGSAKFGEAKFASPIARTTVQIINDVKPAALRGPSEWKPNVEYLGGGRGESFQDIVMHTKDGVVEYYLCHVSHIGVEPGADTSLNTHWTKDKPWEKSQANDFVATKVMFAQRSVIVNLALNDAKAYPMKKDAEGHYTDVLDTEATPTISIDGNTGEMTANGGTFNDITANRGTFNNVTVNKNSTFYGTLKASVIQTDAYACDNEGTWRDIDIENDPHTTYDISFWVFYYTQIQVAHLPNASLYEGVELEFRGMSNRQTEVGLVEGYIKIFYKGAERVISGFRTDGYVKVKAIAGYWVILNYHGSLRVIYNNKERYITEENYADLYDGNEIEVDIFHDVFIVSEGTPSGIVLPRPYTMSKCHVRVITSGTEFYWKCPDGYGINYSNQSISGNQKQYRTHCIELYSSGAAWHELFFSN